VSASAWKYKLFEADARLTKTRSSHQYSHAHTQWVLGNLQEQLGDLEGARGHYMGAFDLDNVINEYSAPDLVALNYDLGRVLYNIHDNKADENALRRAAHHLIWSERLDREMEVSDISKKIVRMELLGKVFQAMGRYKWQNEAEAAIFYLREEEIKNGADEGLND